MGRKWEEVGRWLKSGFNEGGSAGKGKSIKAKVVQRVVEKSFPRRRNRA